MSTRVRVLMVAVLLGCLFLLASCGDSGTTPPPPAPAVSVSISPGTSTISVTETAQFSATVSNSSNTAVTWTASAGTVVDGLFTPPMHSGSYTVTATSQADATKSASATVTVTAPAAEFTTDPVLTASEGTAYSYAVEATDPAGTEVTYSLTSAPEGATIEGNVIAWEPTPEQSRVENTFIVTAHTAAGGVGEQEWTVTPTGTIYGTVIDKYWTADGESTDVANESVSEWYIAALVPQEDGTVTEIDGTGNPDGTFTIPEVPAGHYWLVINDSTFWTDTSNFDFGSDYIGRPYNPDQEVNTNFAFNLFGLSPQWECCWGLNVQSPNAGVWYSTWNYVDWDTTTFNYVEGPVSTMPIDPAQGDVTYVTQWDDLSDPAGMAGKAWVTGVTSGLALDTVVTNPEGSDTTPIEGQMGGTPSTFNYSVKGSDWAKMFIAAGPGAPDFYDFEAELSALPFVTDKFAQWTYYGGVELAYMESNFTSVDQNMGLFRYVNPFPASWKPLFSAQQMADMPVYVPNSSNPAWFEIGSAFITDNVPTGPISPIMSNVANPKINGADFFATTTTDTPAVTLSWDAPTGLPAVGYRVSVYNVYDGGREWYADLFTSEKSVTIPAGLLGTGESYVFMIAAMADSRANIATSPLRHGLPMADSSIVSGAVTIGGEVPTVTFRAKMKAATAKLNLMTTGSRVLRQQRDLRSFTPLQKHAPKPKK